MSLMNVSISAIDIDQNNKVTDNLSVSSFNDNNHPIINTNKQNRQSMSPITEKPYMANSKFQELFRLLGQKSPSVSLQKRNIESSLNIIRNKGKYSSLVNQMEKYTKEAYSLTKRHQLNTKSIKPKHWSQASYTVTQQQQSQPQPQSQPQSLQGKKKTAWHYDVEKYKMQMEHNEWECFNVKSIGIRKCNSMNQLDQIGYDECKSNGSGNSSSNVRMYGNELHKFAMKLFNRHNIIDKSKNYKLVKFL